MNLKIRLLPITLLVLVILALWCFGSTGWSGENGEVIYVAAASSLADALENLAEEFQDRTGVQVRLDFESSGLLRKKIEVGGTGDAFLSASAKDMDWLQESGHIIPQTRRDFLRNKLVCVVPKQSKLQINSPSDLANESIVRIAIGEPRHVPVGEYAAEALKRLKLWDCLAHKLVPCANTRATLAQVEAWTTEAAIVYASDAMISKKVRVAFIFPADSHRSIVYPAAVLKSAKYPQAAKDFLDFIVTPQAAGRFAEFGFEPFSSQTE